MALPLSSPNELRATLLARTAARGVVLALTALGAVMLIAALALWSRYGAAVFFETIAADIAGCL
jgi:hypothetical protein